MSKEDIAKDAARYRYLIEHCSSHFPMTHEQPAEWSIGWEFQQNKPHEAYGSFDIWIDADIERQACADAIDAEESAGADDYHKPDESGYSRADEEWFFGADGKS